MYLRNFLILSLSQFVMPHLTNRSMTSPKGGMMSSKSRQTNITGYLNNQTNFTSTKSKSKSNSTKYV